MDEIFSEIKAERKFQDSKWGTAFDDKNTANDWTAYINEYNGYSSTPLNPELWRKRMIKVAAIAVAAIETFDRNGSLPARHYD